VYLNFKNVITYAVLATKKFEIFEILKNFIKILTFRACKEKVLLMDFLFLTN